MHVIVLMQTQIIPWSKCKLMVHHQILDLNRLQSLLNVAKQRMKFIKSVQVSEDNVSDLLDGHFRVIEILLSALMLKHGLQTRNYQTKVSFFAHYFSFYEKEAAVIKEIGVCMDSLYNNGEFVQSKFYYKHIANVDLTIQLLMYLLA